MKKVKNNNELKGTLSLCLGAFFFTLLSVIFRFLPANIDGFYVAFMRTFLMSILFFIITFFTSDFSILKKRDLPLFLLRSCFVVGDFSMYYLAIIHLPLGTALFLSYAGTLLASYIYGFIFFKERATALKFIYLFLAVLGTYLVFAGSIAQLNNVMIFFAFFSGFLFGLTASSSKHLTHTYSINQVNFVTYFTAAILAIPILFLFKQPLLPHVSLSAWFLFLLMGITSAAIYFFSMFGFKYQDASRASIILLLEIPFSIIVGYFFFKENLTLLAVVGGVLIIVASALPDVHLLLSKKL